MEDYALIFTEKRTIKDWIISTEESAGRITTVRSIEAVGLDWGGSLRTSN